MRSSSIKIVFRTETPKHRAGAEIKYMQKRGARIEKLKDDGKGGSI